MRTLGMLRAPVRAGVALAVGLSVVLGCLWQPSAGAAPAGIFPSLSLSPDAGPAGSPVTVSGSLRENPVLSPSERVAIYFDGVLVGGTSSDWYGEFSATIVIPADARPGVHLIQAMGRQSRVTLWAPFKVPNPVLRPPIVGMALAAGR